MTDTDTPEAETLPTETAPPHAISPNLELWVSYDQAFEYFNEQLFNARLPPCILTFNAKGRSWGYFKRGTWARLGVVNLGR
jgi:hypothetical protein